MPIIFNLTQFQKNCRLEDKKFPEHFFLPPPRRPPALICGSTLARSIDGTLSAKLTTFTDLLFIPYNSLQHSLYTELSQQSLQNNETIYSCGSVFEGKTPFNDHFKKFLSVSFLPFVLCLTPYLSLQLKNFNFPKQSQDCIR